MSQLPFSPKPFVGGGVPVREPVDRIPVVPDLAESRDVQITHQNTLRIVEFVLNRSFEIDDRARSRVARNTVIHADNEETVLKRARLVQVNEQRAGEIMGAVWIEPR